MAVTPAKFTVTLFTPEGTVVHPGGAEHRAAVHAQTDPGVVRDEGDRMDSDHGTLPVHPGGVVAMAGDTGDAPVAEDTGIRATARRRRR